jgi:hypothetical protein
MARVQEHFKNEFGESVAIRAETKVITWGIDELKPTIGIEFMIESESIQGETQFLTKKEAEKLIDALRQCLKTME